MLEDYYYRLFGRSFASLNYVYRDIFEAEVIPVFHSLYKTSYLTAFSSQITVEDLEIRQVTQITENDAILQILGEWNSTVRIERCTIDVKGFLVTNMPVDIYIQDSEILHRQNNYFINAKHPYTTPSIINIDSTQFAEDTLYLDVIHRYPMIYADGYKSVAITNSLFKNRQDLAGLPTLMTVQSNMSAQGDTDFKFTGNTIEGNQDFSLFLSTEQVNQQTSTWDIDVSQNIFDDCQQQFMSLIKMRLNDGKQGNIVL